MPPATFTKQRAFIELIFAASLWGFGFICIRWGLESMGPLWLNALRFGTSFAAGACGLLLFGKIRKNFALHDFWLGAIPGFWLGLSLLLQTYGLLYTTVTKSGFITTLYVVMVPVLGGWLFRERSTWEHYAWVALALLGAAMICNLNSTGITIGDWLTLACALAAAFQILYVGKFSTQVGSISVFTVGQAFGAALLPLIGALLWEPPPSFPLPPKALWGLAILIVGSTWIAFAIQGRAQRLIDAPTVSLLFLLESPFAAFFAFLLLGETLTVIQALGCLVVLVAAGGTIRAGAR